MIDTILAAPWATKLSWWMLIGCLVLGCWCTTKGEDNLIRILKEQGKASGTDRLPTRGFWFVYGFTFIVMALAWPLCLLVMIAFAAISPEEKP